MPQFTAKRYILEGRVQGVGCRATVQEIVENIGHLAGFVRNLPGGQVEICLKGPSWRMDDFDRILRTQIAGRIQIDRILAETLPENFSVTGFTIKR